MKYIYILYACDSTKSGNSMDTLNPICVTTRKSHLLSVLKNDVKNNKKEAEMWKEYGKEGFQLDYIKRCSVLSPYSMKNELNDILTYYYIMVFMD